MVRYRFLLGLAAALSLHQWCPVRPVMVLGGSMEPTLRHGQLALVHRGHYTRQPPRQGDVIVFRHDNMVQVKRVHALPGQRVWEVHYRDSADTVFLLDPDALPRARQILERDPTVWITARDVPPGNLYVLGDGGNASYDSRHYGTVPFSAVLGKVLLRESTEHAATQALDRATLRL
ncbi:MAG TPA: signal peptidase I [Armatimonadota bacterium]|nr:signal peptidase I [Armatimonadota bacterium]